MPLLDFWDSKPETVKNMSLKQVVANAGDGNLKDGSEASKELREYFSQVSMGKLGEYVEYCLSNPFNDSGFVLQDLMNEVGSRLEYDVDWGRYRGVKGKVGADGIWKAPEGFDIVVEVKTSDNYRINLDTVAGYREKLIDLRSITKQSSILFIVGRQDTGDLEAQIRGSKHAWDIRIISADALIKLAELKISSEEDDTLTKIRGLLTPFEYTRLDNIIDVVFTTANDVEKTKDVDFSTDHNHSNQQIVVTAPEIINKIRSQVISKLAAINGVSLIAKSKALYWTKDKNVKVACTVSKRHDNNIYWYAYHPSWDTFFGSVPKSYMAFGCVGINVAFVIPVDVFRTYLPSLHVTNKSDGGMYWHIHIHDQGNGIYTLRLPKINQEVDLTEFKMDLSS